MPQPMRQKGENMITVETLTKLGACVEGVTWFAARYPEGLSLENWTRDEQIAALRSGGGRWLMWGVDRNLLPWWSLSGADLSRAYLSGAYLIGADLSRADLRGADLSGAYLSRADLRGADLSGAYLSRANLGGAHLGGAYLTGANLGGANLSGADLREADLSGAIVCNHTIAPAGFAWPDGVVRVED